MSAHRVEPLICLHDTTGARPAIAAQYTTGMTVESELRSRRVLVRLTVAEHEALRRLAAETTANNYARGVMEQVSMSAIVRRLIRERAERAFSLRF